MKPESLTDQCLKGKRAVSTREYADCCQVPVVKMMNWRDAAETDVVFVKVLVLVK
jgi:hypothetical protein